MKRVDRILKHSLFRSCVEKTRERERDRDRKSVV